jgi:hypothetical protein
VKLHESEERAMSETDDSMDPETVIHKEVHCHNFEFKCSHKKRSISLCTNCFSGSRASH